MKRKILTYIFSFGCLLFFSLVIFGQEPSGYPITEYLGMTLFPEVAVSPDARHVAFIASRDNFVTNLNDSTIWKMDIDSEGRKTVMARLPGECGEVSGL